MPSLPSDLFTNIYRRAKDLPPKVWDTLKSNARNANVILPQALKAYTAEADNPGYRRENVWITCSSRSNILFILAITEGYTGAYPVFIMTTLPFHRLTDSSIRPCINVLIKALLDARVPRHRVYSVFAPEPITELFAAEWEHVTGIRRESDPYYAAKITYCTLDKLDKRSSTVDQSFGYNLRPAVLGDIPAISELGFLFAEESFPFQLSRHGAFEEATLLVQNDEVWVHEARLPGQPKEIASIVAFTRNSETVAAITKVFTNPKWRRRGCAERLVRRVCRYLLTDQKKESVVLYVAHNNAAANHVYHRVGFAGLSNDTFTVDGVDPWLEIGFDRNQVQLGHW
ncbi:hypothetical protein Hypma_007459 [Hypsizygus marmoreus]|uniref:N-acetyltransferase domain-containing protein n=1 Tax=Hypsizygus marmoreus TaxID=39966 RepID=A0A369K3D2_HYPMA|nr:hypothetical protein Hypma_007459 [Hypsizygus marmoreus]